ncbi:hypothetical protein KEM52_004288 [Ascosphaera acerosa]|nr:hypothetical protein KEM52_004288 [Ascosphaera acerosa]
MLEPENCVAMDGLYCLRDHDKPEEYTPKRYVGRPHDCECKPACTAYAVGDVLDFYTDMDPAKHGRSRVRLRVESMTRKWSNSVGLVVQVLDNADLKRHWRSSVGFLKLYDRRFSGKARKSHGNVRWSQGLEHGLFTRIQASNAPESRKRLQNVLNWATRRTGVVSGRRDDTLDAEQSFALHQIKEFTDEFKAYDRLYKLQGTVLPRIFTAGFIDVSPKWLHEADPAAAWPHREIYFIPGLLMENLPGDRLCHFDDIAPVEAWPVLFELAATAVLEVQLQRIIRSPIHPKNFICIHVGDGYEKDDYRVFMIDLRRCKMRSVQNPAGWLSVTRKQQSVLQLWMDKVELYQGEWMEKWMSRESEEVNSN